MSHLRTLIRCLSALGAGGTAVLALVVPGPASADPVVDPAGGSVDVGRARDQIPPLTAQQRRRLLDQIDHPGATYYGDGGAGLPRPSTRTITVDDGSIELTQVALGAIGGAALAASGAAAVSTRHRRNPPHPA